MPADKIIPLQERLAEMKQLKLAALGCRSEQETIQKIAEYLSNAAESINAAYAIIALLTNKARTPLEEAYRPRREEAP